MVGGEANSENIAPGGKVTNVEGLTKRVGKGVSSGNGPNRRVSIYILHYLKDDTCGRGGDSFLEELAGSHGFSSWMQKEGTRGLNEVIKKF